MSGRRLPVRVRSPADPEHQTVLWSRILHKVRAMDTASLLLELYGRIPPLAAAAVEGLDEDQLCRVPEPGANPIGWLVWHLARVPPPLWRWAGARDSWCAWSRCMWPR